MHIELEVSPPPPVWPEGIRVRVYDPQRDLEALGDYLIARHRSAIQAAAWA